MDHSQHSQRRYEHHKKKKKEKKIFAHRNYFAVPQTWPKRPLYTSDTAGGDCAIGKDRSVHFFFFGDDFERHKGRRLLAPTLELQCVLPE